VKAVHFGAGNIGRGFVGLLLHDAGYEVVFADVAEELINQLATADSYAVHEVGENPAVRTVDNFRALNSGTQEAELDRGNRDGGHRHHRGGAAHPQVRGPGHRQGHRCEGRRAGAAAGDGLRERHQRHGHPAPRSGVPAWGAAAGSLDGKAVFANTAVDRIVPNQAAARAWTSRWRPSTNGSSTGRRSAVPPRRFPVPPSWTSFRRTSSASCSR
jgi:mannitol-1-phosphate 5-dehydrogenase